MYRNNHVHILLCAVLRLGKTYRCKVFTLSVETSVVSSVNGSMTAPSILILTSSSFVVIAVKKPSMFKKPSPESSKEVFLDESNSVLNLLVCSGEVVVN